RSLESNAVPDQLQKSVGRFMSAKATVTASADCDVPVMADCRGPRSASGGRRRCKKGRLPMERTFRFFVGTIGMAALGLQFWLMTKYPGSRSLPVTITRFLSFFTIQTNILLTLCMLLPALAPRHRVSELLSRPSLRTAVVSYSAVLAIIYFFL